MYFDKPYNRQEFLKTFQIKICPNFVKEERSMQITRKTAYFVENGIFRLGAVKLDKEITVLEIQQKSSKDPRITLTKDAFKILSDYGLDHAIIVFYSKDNTSYRLSLLTVSYADWDNKKTSSYKRYSYILWPGEKTKTPEKQLLHPIKDYDDLVSRFDVEVVRKDFFERYLELFVRLYKDIKKDTDFTNLLLSQKVDIVSFTKNLLWKIVFLYFIQQKWWLGLWHREKEYGKGNKDFMRIMRNNFKNNWESMSTEKTWFFYNDYLERLFFAWLNVDRRDNEDRFPNLQMKVPYLNWWLFKEDYQWRERYVTKINNDIFSNVDSKWDEADWILDVFDRYNFTIDEDSLYDSDIAVDPEMLGRIFEKMISISNDNIDEVIGLYDNKGKKSKIDFWKELNKKLWAFYTPREIVHYMTKESLIAFLVSNIKWDNEENEDLIRDLFALKEQFLLHQEDLKKVWFGENTLTNLSEIIDQIDEALKKVKILDPAIWSWAFPMWLLHEISSIRYYMYGVFHSVFGDKTKEYKNKENKISMYQIKREIILNNIYWVDIDPGAIDIARLRFWLSLVVDEDHPEPLPNFEFKFVCANTLIPLEEETKERDLFAQWDEPKLETLKKYKREYYNASGNKEKRELKERIRDYTKIDGTLFSEPTPRAKQMAEFGANFDNSKHSHSFFDPSLMMSEWRGFDIIIGNPPYALVQNIKDWIDIKTYLWIYEIAQYKVDLYHLFFQLWIDMLKISGILSYITPNTFLTNKHTDKLRKYIMGNTKIIQIIDCKFSVFNSASVDTGITIFQKNTKNNNIDNTIQCLQRNENENLPSTIRVLEQKDAYKDEYVINLKGDQTNFPKSLSNLNIKRLWDICISYFGIQAFDKSTSTYKQQSESNDLIPIIDGSEINKYSWANSENYFDYKKINIKSWWDWEIYSKDRIVVRQIWMYPVVGLAKSGVLSSNTMYNLIPNKDFSIFFMLWILSSRFLSHWRIVNFSDNKKLFPKIKWFQLKEIPIINISIEQQKPIIEKVEQILAITNQPWCNIKNPSKEQLELEKEINQMVYELYGLAEDEIKVVEESVK